MASIEERVQKIVAEQLGVEEEQVTMEASFMDDLGADSLDTVELVMALEEEFEIEISDEDAEKIQKVKDNKNNNGNYYRKSHSTFSDDGSQTGTNHKENNTRNRIGNNLLLIHDNSGIKFYHIQKLGFFIAFCLL